MGNGNIHRAKILIASLMSVIAAIADIYVIVNMPFDYFLLGIISLVLLVAVYFVVNGVIQLRDWNNVRAEEQYNSLITSQKACYLQIRKSFRETSGKISELDKKVAPLAASGEMNHQKISNLLDILMQDQKKIAKITVSRSKENANAIMNSNDKVIEVVLNIQEAINNIMEQADSGQQTNQSEEFEKLEQKQQELLSKMQQLEDSLKCQIATITDGLQNIQINEKEILSDELIPEKEPISEEPILEEAVIEPLAEELIPEEPIPEETVIEPLEEEPIPEEPVPEEAVIEPLEEEPIPEELIPEEPVLEEAVIEPLEEEPIPEEPIPEEAVMEDSVVSAEPAMSDPGHMMTPEEIAALIAGEEEVLPETVEEPIMEEKSAEPATSDPSHMMTPEEIAALIANL